MEALVKSVPINQKTKGIIVYDVNSQKYIKTLAGFFKEKNIIKPPAWAGIVKTANSNEIAPLDPDYFYIRAAAIARIFYVKSKDKKNIGVGTLKSFFGKKFRRGCQPPTASKAAGKIIRTIIQQLKAADLIEELKNPDQNTTYGFTISKKGRSELDKIAAKCVREQK